MPYACCFVHLLYRGTLDANPRKREGGRWKVEARERRHDWCTTCSAVTGAVSATSHSARSHMSVHLVYVVHVSRTPAVLRCALRRFASRASLTTYLLEL